MRYVAAVCCALLVLVSACTRTGRQVQAELARVQAELDSLEGQLRVLQSSVSLSELTVTLNRRLVLGPLGIVAPAVGTVLAKRFVWR